MKWARLCLKNILRQTDKDKTSNILAPATSAEVEYNNIQALTQTFPQWVKALETYTGCGDMIRQVRFLRLHFTHKGHLFTWKSH